jgi:hypothetical protein
MNWTLPAHLPNTTAPSMLGVEHFTWVGQASMKVYGRTVVDENHKEQALRNAEGQRIAGTIGETFDDLYYFERATEV